MRRDDPGLQGLPPPVAAAGAARRTPMYLGTGGDALFAWLHEPGGAFVGDQVAVICPPVGSEYTRSHRSLRHLADRLARAGVPALRFDYHGIGDSPGTQIASVCHRFQEPELGLADGHEVTVVQLLAFDPHGVHEDAVRATEVFDYDVVAS